MVALLLCSHSDFSQSLKRTAEMIYGTLEACDTVSFQENDALPDLAAEIRTKYGALSAGGDPVVCLCDLPFASPYNACCMALADTDARVIPGMSLPLVISLASDRDDVTAEGLDTFLAEAIENAQGNMAIHIPKQLLAD